MSAPVSATAESIRLDGCVVDLAAQVAHWPDGARALTGTEVRLLRYLASRPGRVVSQRELLERVWGYRAGVLSRTVKTTIARLRVKVERAPNAPRHVVTVVGGGYRLDLLPLETVHPPSSAPEVLIPGPPTSELPSVAELVGRERERSSIIQALAARTPWITLVGPAGVGKSALAISVLRQARSDDARVVRLAQLAPAQDEDAACRTIGAALGARIPTDAGPLAMEGIRRALDAQTDILLCLDGVDRHVDVVRQFARADEAPRGGPSILATARQPLGVPGERVLSVAPLSPRDSAELFHQRAGSTALPGYANREALAAILGHLDGLPLAIELSAGWAALLDPPGLEERLRSGLSVLDAGDGALRAAFSSAWSLLDEVHRDALAQLAVFAGSASIEAIESVIVPLSGEAPLGLVRRLHHRSLLALHPDSEGGSPRFSVLATLRPYVRASAPSPDARRRHARWCAGLGEEAALYGLRRRGADRAFARIAASRPDLEAALEWSMAAAEWDLAGRILRALLAWSSARGPALAYESAAAALCEQSFDPALRAWVLLERAAAASLSGRSSDAGALGREAHERFLQIKDAAGVSRSMTFRARNALRSHDSSALGLAVSAVSEAGSVSGLRAAAISVLGAALSASGRHEDARVRLTEALRLARGVEDRRVEAECLEQLGRHELARGRSVRALSYFSSALAAAVDLGDRALEADLLEAVAGVEIRNERFEAAITPLRRALAIRRELGHRTDEGRAEAMLAEAFLGGGERSAARGALERALVIALGTSDRALEVHATAQLGRLELELGRLREARLAFVRGMAMARELGAPRWIGVCQAGLGELAFLAGDPAAGREGMSGAARSLSEAGLRAIACDVLRRWTELELDAGEPERAAAVESEADHLAELSNADGPATLAGDGIMAEDGRAGWR